MPWQLPERYEGVSASYDEALAALAATQRLGICPLLETVEDMLDELGRPDAAYRIVQIAGTNGKTSTARYTAQILAGEGLATALYTSPELVSMTERMEVGGQPVSEEAFGRAVAVAIAAGETVNARRRARGERPYDVTEFDLLTVAALVAFAEAGVEVAVLEVGMGGRWDATTATWPEVTCVSGIGLDHTHILGDTLEAIAAEKAAIIRRGQRGCVLGPGCLTMPSVRAVLEGRAREEEVRATLVVPSVEGDTRIEPDSEFGGTPAGDDAPRATFAIAHEPAFLGDRLVVDVRTPHGAYGRLAAAKPSYQAQNIACAVTLAETFLGRPLDGEALRASVATCPTPGRFDIVGTCPLHLVDACHNPQSVETFLASLVAVAPERESRPPLLAACLADKDSASMARLLAGEFPAIYVTQTSSPRALAAPELAARFEACEVAPVAAFGSVDEACEALADRPYVALGSITLAGEVARWHRFHGIG